MAFFARIAALLGCATALACTALPAVAAGTVTVYQKDGTVETYANSPIKVIHDAMYITSSDGKGTLVISRAACFSHKGLLTCLPTGITLVQQGGAKKLDLDQGTLYVNVSKETKQLPLSSVQLPPNGVMLSFTTLIGTTVNVSGVIDKGNK